MEYLIEVQNTETKEHIESFAKKVGRPRTLKNFLIVESDLTPDDFYGIEGVINVEEDAEDEELGWALPYIAGQDRGFDPERTGEGVDIYVMDTGIRLDHSEFSGCVETVYSYDGKDFEPCKPHGTGTASCAVGKRFGVAKEANLFNVRYKLNRADGIRALDNVLDHHLNKDSNNPSILNMSFGSSSRIIKDALIYLYHNGIICVAAAGNDDSSRKQYPASNKFVISVMANNRRDKPSEFTNYSSGNDLFAPGTRVRAAGAKSDNETTTVSGTSFAAPYTAGVLALIVQGSTIQSSAGVDQAKKYLLEQCWEDTLILEGKYSGLPNLVANCNVENNPIDDKVRFTVRAKGPVKGKSEKEVLKGEKTRFKLKSNDYEVKGNNPGGKWVGNVFETNPITEDCDYLFK